MTGWMHEDMQGSACNAADLLLADAFPDVILEDGRGKDCALAAPVRLTSTERGLPTHAIQDYSFSCHFRLTSESGHEDFGANPLSISGDLVIC